MTQNASDKKQEPEYAVGADSGSCLFMRGCSTLGAAVYVSVG